MKKLLSMLLALTLTLAACFTMVGCGRGDKIDDSENVLNVKIRKAGFGTTYITELGKEFEKTFASEGYKVNVLPAEADLLGGKVYTDVYSGSKVDLFFSDSYSAKELSADGKYGQIAADITESVWNKKPISFDGSEEDKTVKDKLEEFFDMDSVYYKDKVYGMPFAAPVGGIAVNTKVLDQYDLEVPRTTDEMFACAEVLMENALTDEIFPFTYSFSGNLYVNRIAGPWIAQAGGYEDYYKFFTWNNVDGTNIEDPSEVYGYKGVRDMLEVMFHYYDYNMMSYGSDSHDISAAQGQIMKGEALFYSVGDWMFQEEYVKFPNYRNDVLLIPAPMISSLGVELFGDEYPDKHDAILSEICKYALDGKLAEDIEPLVESALSVELDLQDVTTVCERRGYVPNSCSIGVVMNNNSTKKDLAATFLRFIASTDAGKVFAREAMTQSPYALKEKIDSEYQWFDGVNQMYTNPYFKQLKGDSVANSMKLAYGLTGYFPSLDYIFTIDISRKNVTKYDEYDLSILPGKSDAVYRVAADELCDFMVADAKAKLADKTWEPLNK